MTAVLHGGPNEFTDRLVATAHPTPGAEPDHLVPTSVLKVSDLQISAVLIPGPFPAYEYHVGFNVTNTDQEAISHYSTMIGFIKP